MLVQQRKTLSSSQTLFAKFIFPTFWIATFGGVTLSLWFGAFKTSGGVAEPFMKWLFLLFWVIGSGFIGSVAMRIKRVRVDAAELHVSNYFKEISVPFAQIEKVTEIRWINWHPVTLKFRAATAFGSSVTFLPKMRPFGFWSTHPVVAELNRLAGLPETGRS
jgi:hypothetical protein